VNRLAYTRVGTGEPLVLLHALGLSRSAWDPVLTELTDRFDVIAVDMPGFGDSPPLDPDLEPEPAALARSVAELLDELGLAAPHVAGNSLGGWVAAELAGMRPVASLTLLSPAGMWSRETPSYCWISLRLTRLLVVRARPVVRRLVRRRWGRLLVLWQAVGHPTRMAPEQAVAVVDAIATSRGYDNTLRATRRRRFRAERPIDAPVTVAFGSRDRVLLRRAWRQVGELPPQTLVASLPGCGHVPMSDDPGAVAALLARVSERGPVSPGSSGRRPSRSDLPR
jgi:pimeloyl-ACP methyl ester carboxylesterase